MPQDLQATAMQTPNDPPARPDPRNPLTSLAFTRAHGLPLSSARKRKLLEL